MFYVTSPDYTCPAVYADPKLQNSGEKLAVKFDKILYKAYKENKINTVLNRKPVKRKLYGC